MPRVGFERTILLERRLGGPQGPSGHCGEEKHLLPLSGIEPRPATCRYTDRAMLLKKFRRYLVLGIHGKDFRANIID
jgi:hypothetical protein